MNDDPRFSDERVIESCGNVFLDLGFPPDEAQILALRSSLMNQLNQIIHERGWNLTETVQHLGISQVRASELLSGKWDHFSLDTLLTLAARAGKQVRLELVEPW